MNIIGAIVAGIVATIVITIMMALGPRMGMPKMDMPGMLGAMFSKESNRTLGMIIHLMMGAIFAIIYAALWNAGIGSVGILWGLIFGVAHWLVVGLVMGAMPMMHAGIQAGTIDTPGIYMTASAGMAGFVGGLMGHIVYGIVTALIYGLFVT